MSMVEDVRKVVQDFLAPELRSISTRMDALEKQRTEDKSDILHAFETMAKQRAEDRADMLRGFETMEKQRAEDRADMLRGFEVIEKQRAEDKADMLRGFEVMEKQRIVDKADMLRAFAEGNAHMEKRFELVVDYTKVLQRVNKLEEAQSKSN